jgi:hypothetical protein
VYVLTNVWLMKRGNPFFCLPCYVHIAEFLQLIANADRR